MTCKHLFLSIFLSLILFNDGLWAQELSGTTQSSPTTGLATTGVIFNLSGVPCTAASAALTGVPCTPGLIDTTAFFILYGDGTFGSGTGLDMMRQHKYPTAGNYTATAWFAGKKHGSPPPALTTTVTTGSAPSTYSNPSSAMPTNVKLSTSWLPVAGMGHFIILSVENKAATEQAGTISFYYNSGQVSFSTTDYNPVPFFTVGATVNNPGTSVYNKKRTWTFTNLNPGEQRHIFLWANVSSTLPKGTPLWYKATNSNTYGDAMSGNISSPYLTLSGFPHDPNQKEANYKFICANQPEMELAYHISFQNDGDTYANTVEVVDQLDGNLNAGTASLYNSSHECTFTPGNNPAVFSFLGIQLPGSNQLSPHQYAYSETVGDFIFKVYTQPNLGAGSIPNVANIIFDGLPPVPTNVEEVLVEDTPEGVICELGTPAFIDRNSPHQILQVKISPNPFSDLLSIGLPTMAQGETALLDIFSLSGQVVLHTALLNNASLDLQTSDWPAGIYFARIQTPHDSKVLRLVKQ